jgi:hypothetical protein
MNAPAPSNNNSRSVLLNTLASSGNQVVQLGTLGLVAISGLTSFFQTQQVGEQGSKDRDRAIHEIHQLYEKVDEFEARQTTILKTQNSMLANQESVLKIMKDNQQRELENLMRKNGP